MHQKSSIFSSFAPYPASEEEPKQNTDPLPISNCTAGPKGSA
ncbi:riboflavin synthase subunit beta [Roseobacter sp. SK209-2-6]|nr:riboflavin synthase subunit beta [Roseobacter sp. SK209-2-6]